MNRFFKDLTIPKSILMTFILYGILLFLIFINVKLLNFDFNTTSFISQLLILVIIIILFNNYFFQLKDLECSFLKIIQFTMLGVTIGTIYYIYQFILSNKISQQYEITISLLIESIFLGVIYEELFFRGIILKGLLKKHRPYVAIITSSLLFSLIHINQILYPLKFLSLFILGITCSIFYVKNKKVIIPIIIHASYNIGIIFFPKILNLI